MSDTGKQPLGVNGTAAPTGVKAGFTNVNMSHQRNLFVEATGFIAGSQKKDQTEACEVESSEVYYSELAQSYVARLNITLLREKYTRLNLVIHLACNK